MLAFRSPNLLPLLDPEYVVECIMEAVLTNRSEVFLPRLLYWDVWVAG